MYAVAFPADDGFDFDKQAWIFAVDENTVRRNFERYGLLDEHIHFLKGWFRDTLPTIPVSAIALLRLDGDLYESTIQALDALYPKLSPGAFCVIDDYGVLEPCRKAVHDYRDKHHIEEEIVDIDGSGVFWRKSLSG